MRVQNVRFKFSRLCVWSGFFTLAVVPLISFGQGVAVPASSNFQNFINTSTGANSQTVGFSKTGVPIAQPGVQMSAGMPRVVTDVALKNPSGGNLALKIFGKMSAVEITAAVSRVAGRFLLPVAAASSLYQLYQELGYTVKDGLPNAQTNMLRPTTGATPVTVPSMFDTVIALERAKQPPCPSKYMTDSKYKASFRAWDAGINSAGKQQITVWCWATDENGLGQYSLAQPLPVTYVYDSAPAQLAPVPAASVESELTRRLKLTSPGFSDTSVLPKVLADPLAGPIVVTDLQVQGPASSPGMTTTSTITKSGVPAGSQTTAVDYQHTYAAPPAGSSDPVTITTTQRKTVTTLDPAGVPTVEVTATPVSNTPIVSPTPVETVDPCAKNLDRAGCANLGALDAPSPLGSRPIPFEVGSAVFASGSCPSPVAFSVLGRSFTFSYSGFCDVLEKLKYVFLLIAGYIAARIVSSSFKV